MIVLDEIFGDLSLLNLNKLTKKFPKLDPKTGNEYISSTIGNREFINYIFHLIYPELKAGRLERPESYENFCNFLMNLDLDAISSLWAVKHKYIYSYYNKLKIKESYLEILSQDKFLKILNLRLERFGLLEKEERKISSLLLLYLTEESIQSINTTDWFPLLVRSMKSDFTHEEIDLYLILNQNLIEFVRMYWDSYDEFSSISELGLKNEIECIINILEYEYSMVQDSINGSLSKNYTSEGDGNYYFRFEYMAQVLSSFPDKARLSVLEKIESNEQLKNSIRKKDIAFLYAMKNENYHFLRKTQSASA
ncbi:MAG: hypothetical protein H7A24_14480 [Leptospiraceae bacterium]|nr:hypothetical protein [Leptospiraceae bacterium]MCP5513089.1 hypothetical protein [Leptospiraceae bacterium]